MELSIKIRELKAQYIEPLEKEVKKINEQLESYIEAQLDEGESTLCQVWNIVCRPPSVDERKLRTDQKAWREYIEARHTIGRIAQRFPKQSKPYLIPRKFPTMN